MHIPTQLLRQQSYNELFSLFFLLSLSSLSKGCLPKLIWNYTCVSIRSCYSYCSIWKCHNIYMEVSQTLYNRYSRKMQELYKTFKMHNNVRTTMWNKLLLQLRNVKHLKFWYFQWNLPCNWAESFQWEITITLFEFVTEKLLYQ